jgi:hypothetical protein
MRELTKSMMSYTWATSLLGVQQMVNLLTPQQGQRQSHPATETFNNVAQCTVEQMGGVMRATFRAGDNIQRGMVDMMFGMMTLGAGGGGRRDGQSGSGAGGGWGRQAASAGQQTAEAFRQGVSAMGQAADVVGQAAGGAATGWGRGGGGGGGQQPDPTGWGPVPPAPQGRGR